MVAGIAGAAAVLTILAAAGSVSDRWWLLLVVVLLVLLGLDRRATQPPTRKGIGDGILAGALLFAALQCSLLALHAVRTPPQWDFRVFWLNGRVAAEGHDFYEPTHYKRLGALGDHSPDFREEILEVGFWYPPPSMFLFLPLGWTDVQTAARGWYAVNGVALVLDIVLLRRLFVSGSGVAGLPAVAALVFLLRSTQSTIRFGQTNFLVLLFVLLYLAHPRRFRGGAALAGAILTKPFAAFLLPHVLVRASWRPLGGVLAALGIAALMSLWVFGAETCMHFLRSNPVTRLPAYVYTQGVNQSLLGTLLRLEESGQVGATFPRLLFFVAPLFILGMTLWALKRVRASEHLAFGLVLSFALLLYPATLEHYGVLLLIPMLILWSRKSALPGGGRLVAAFTAVEYALVSLDGRGVFVAFLLSWIGFAALGIIGTRRREIAILPELQSDRPLP